MPDNPFRSLSMDQIGKSILRAKRFAMYVAPGIDQGIAAAPLEGSKRVGPGERPCSARRGRGKLPGRLRQCRWLLPSGRTWRQDLGLPGLEDRLRPLGRRRLPFRHAAADGRGPWKACRVPECRPRNAGSGSLGRRSFFRQERPNARDEEAEGTPAKSAGTFTPIPSASGPGREDTFPGGFTIRPHPERRDRLRSQSYRGKGSKGTRFRISTSAGWFASSPRTFTSSSCALRARSYKTIRLNCPRNCWPSSGISQRAIV